MPAAAAPPFKHIIIVIQENRTPDNLFGADPSFEPGVDIATSGMNSAGQTIPFAPTPLAGCYDLGHSHVDFVNAFTEGADKVLVGPKPGCKVPAHLQFKFTDNSKGEIQPYFDIATNYGFANRMFQTNQGPSMPAHQFLFGGTSSPTAESPDFAASNPNNIVTGCVAPPDSRMDLIDPQGVLHKRALYPCFTRRTMSELLDGANLSWKYYGDGYATIWMAPTAISQICRAETVNGTATCTGTAWKEHVSAPNPAQLLTDIENCNLPNVTWVTPTGAESDHPSSNKGLGPGWVASIVNTVGNQGACGENKEVYWNDTAILITWDDWGGWYDHVRPFAIPTAPSWGAGFTYGFRVPLLVVSPFTAAGTVSNSTYDFGSMLYFVETNFGLGTIGQGDTAYSNYADYQAAQRGPLGDFFNYTAPPRAFTPIAIPQSAHFFRDRVPDDIPPDND